MKFPKTFSSKRLNFRKPTLKDAKHYYEIASDPDVVRFLGFEIHKSLEESIDYLNLCCSEWRHDGDYKLWIIEEKDGGEFVGAACLYHHIRYKDHVVEMGYSFKREKWGCGYATETARAIIIMAFSFPEINRIESFCDVENLASARSLEKNGFTKEGILREYASHPNLDSENFRDVFVY